MITGAFFIALSVLILNYASSLARHADWHRAMVCSVVSLFAFTIGCTCIIIFALKVILEKSA